MIRSKRFGQGFFAALPPVLPRLQRSLPGVLLEITAEEAHVGEVIVAGQLLDALRRTLQLHLDLQHGVLVDDALRRMARHLAHDVSEVFRGDAHQGGVVGHVSRPLIIPFEQHHEAAEQLAHPIRLHAIRHGVGVAPQILVKPDEEGLQLIEHQLREAGTLGLLEIDPEQGEHAVDEAADNGRVLPTAILAQGGIDRMLDLQAGLAQERGAVAQQLDLEPIGRSQLNHVVGEDDDDSPRPHRPSLIIDMKLRTAPPTYQ